MYASPDGGNKVARRYILFVIKVALWWKDIYVLLMAIAVWYEVIYLS
jgi:hypothetical protein